MLTNIICTSIYLIGFMLAFTMQRVEHEAEHKTYTKGDHVLNIVLSLLSFLIIIFILVSAWVNKISKTGYWNRPRKNAITEPQLKPE